MLPELWRKLILYSYIVCNSAITSTPGHEHDYNGLWYDRTTGVTRTDLVSRVFGAHLCMTCLFALYWHQQQLSLEYHADS